MTGLSVTGLSVTGLSVTGLYLTDLSLIGLSLTGLSLTGLSLRQILHEGDHADFDPGVPDAGRGDEEDRHEGPFPNLIHRRCS